jgi:hypothetical protein
MALVAMRHHPVLTTLTGMTQQTPAGWYPDPYGSPQLRWWDGNQWTDATHALETASPSPHPPIGSPQTGPQHGPGQQAGARQWAGPPPQAGPPSPAGPESPAEPAATAQPTHTAQPADTAHSGDTAQPADQDVDQDAGTAHAVDAGQAPESERPSGQRNRPDEPSGRPVGPPPDRPAAPSGPFAPPPAGAWGHPAPPQGPPFGHPGAPTAQAPRPSGAGGPHWGPHPGATAQLPVPDFGMPTGEPPRRGNVWPWILGGGGAVILLVAIVIAAVTLVNTGRDRILSVATPAPTFSSPPPQTSTPEPGPSQEQQSGVELPRPENGRITDPQTGLSYAFPGAPWEVPSGALNSGGDPTRQQWTSAVQALSHEKYDGTGDWIGNVYTGPLHEIFPYNGPKDLRATIGTVFTAYNSRFYGPPHEHKIVQDKALKVSGRDAWLLEFELDFTEVARANDWKWRKERGALVLVDRRDGGRPSLLYMSVPDNLDTSVVKRVLESLKVE